MACYPMYTNPDAWELVDLVDAINKGRIIDLILSTLPKKDEIPLGAFSIPLTKPVNGMTVKILVDLNALESDNVLDWYIMQVVDDGDGFMKIKNDVDSVEMAIVAIQNNTMPLHNVTVNVNTDVTLYPYIIIEDENDDDE